MQHRLAAEAGDEVGHDRRAWPALDDDTLEAHRTAEAFLAEFVLHGCTVWAYSIADLAAEAQLQRAQGAIECSSPLETGIFLVCRAHVRRPFAGPLRRSKIAADVFRAVRERIHSPGHGQLRSTESASK